MLSFNYENVLFLSEMVCVRVSPADGWLWVLGGGLCLCFFLYNDSYHKTPCEGNNPSSLSFLRLPHNGFSVSVSWSLDSVSLCICVFRLCLVFESDTAYALRVGEDGSGEVEHWLGGWLVLECAERGIFPIFSPLALVFSYSGAHHTSWFHCFTFPRPGISIKRSPTSSIFNYRFLSLFGFKALFPGRPKNPR